jgi:hypothetical protein
MVVVALRAANSRRTVEKEADQRRIAAVLTNLGWQRHEKKDYEGNRWWSKA